MRWALLGSVPATLTLLLVFGCMAALRIPMNVGTSMMTSIALGIGIDYAVHMMWRLQRLDSPQDDMALRVVSWGIVVNALEVAAGFSLLMLASMRPMQQVGGLTALAMLLSAVCTLALLPVWMRPKSCA